MLGEFYPMHDDVGRWGVGEGKGWEYLCVEGGWYLWSGY